MEDKNSIALILLRSVFAVTQVRDEEEFDAKIEQEEEKVKQSKEIKHKK